MAVTFIYLKDAESDEGDNFNRSQAAPPNAELERLDDSGSSESTTESTTEKPLSAKEKKALKKKKDQEEAEKDVFDQTQQKYYLPDVGYLIMEFEGKAYVVLVEKRYPLSVEVRVRFYESWDNGDPLTTRFKFEDGTRAHARVPARYILRVIAEPVPCDKRGFVKLNDRDLSEYLSESDYLDRRAERIQREEAAAKKSSI